MIQTLCYLHWRDASMNYGVEESREDAQLLDLYELGFLFHETAESVTLTMESDDCDGDKTRMRLTVPKSCIIERVDVPAAKFLRWARKKPAKVLASLESRPK